MRLKRILSDLDYKKLACAEQVVCDHFEISPTELMRTENRTWRHSLSRQFLYYLIIKFEILDNYHQIALTYKVDYMSIEKGVAKVALLVGTYSINADDLDSLTRKLKIKFTRNGIKY